MAQGSTITQANIKQINGVTPLMGAGNGGTGSLRVNIASDQVSIPVAATLTAETTKVIGTVNISASQTIAVTNTGTFAVQAAEADGANVTLGAKADAKSTATDTTAVTIMSVLKQISASVQAPPSQAVTNAGTFAVQATEAILDAALISQEATTSSIKGLTAFGAVTTAAPTYVTGKSDALSLTTAGALRSDIATIAGTAPTTVGKLDVKGADGDVFVRQTTASSLNATVVGTGTFAVQATPVTQADTFMLGGVNIKEINAVTPLMGAGNGGTGSLRVNIASDQVSIPVAATLSAETTKVIGTVNIAASQTVGLVAGTALVGKVGIDQTTPGTTNAVSIAQIGANTISSGVGASGTGTFRTVIANDTGRTLLSKGGSVASSGDNTLVAAGTNRLKVFAFSLSTVSTTAVTCIFQSGASGTELWRVVLQTPASVAGGANLVVQPPAWLFATASATLLNLNLSAAVTVHYSLSYFDEA